MELIDKLDDFLRTLSAPFSPYIVWEVNPVKFPINSMEIFFIAMVVSLFTYIAGSLLTAGKPYNLERMLHRGVYNTDGDRKERYAWTWRNLLNKLIGITPEYTRGDRIITWSVFIYTFGYQLMACFVLIIIWNVIYPWPAHWWGTYFYWNSLVIAGIIGLATTVWFLCGGIKDAILLFKALSTRVDNPLDDGRVEKEVSLADLAYTEKIESEISSRKP